MFEPKDQKQLNQEILEKMERAQNTAMTIRGILWGLAIAIVLAMIIGSIVFNSHPHTYVNGVPVFH